MLASMPRRMRMESVSACAAFAASFGFGTCGGVGGFFSNALDTQPEAARLTGSTLLMRPKPQGLSLALARKLMSSLCPKSRAQSTGDYVMEYAGRLRCSF